MAIEKILAYAAEYAAKEAIDITSLDFSDLEKAESYRKDNSELNAAAIKEIEKRINALKPAVKKPRYTVKNPVLHNGVVYGAGEDVSGKIEEKSLKLLLEIGAVVEE